MAVVPRGRRSSSRGRSPAGGLATRIKELPLGLANDLLAGFKGRLHTVKTQQLNLEDGTSILIARVKVPTPKGVSGHLIRRFDTDALSASSLFRVAYPLATDEAEQSEMAYVTKRYNTQKAGDEDANGSGKLTGTWVPLEDAATLAKDYGLSKFASELINFDSTAETANDGGISSPAPTPRKSKSPAPPTSASARSKRARVMSPPIPPPSVSTRSQTSAMQSLQAPTPSRDHRTIDLTDEENETVSEEPTGEAGGIQITQEIVKDEVTGKSVEETKVTYSGARADDLTGGNETGLLGSEELARQAAEDALKLIDSLKAEGILKGSNGGKRDREIEEAEHIDGVESVIDAVLPKQGTLKRWFGRKPRTAKKAREPEIGQLQVMQSPDGAQVLVAPTMPTLQPEANRRRYIAMAGMVVMGAATAAAPYVFG